MAKEIILTDEQKQKILDFWNSYGTNSAPSIADLVKVTFGDDVECDGRGKFAKAVKEFLSTRSLVPTQASTYKPVTPELTEEQKEYVRNFSSTMKDFEIAREIFKNPKILNLHKESRAVNKYLRTLPREGLIEDPEKTTVEEYKAPNAVDRVVARINRYNKDVEYDATALTPKVKKHVMALMAYLHDTRFVHQINTYGEEKDRELFESTFIKYTFDKPDLTKEDLDQYVILSTEAVMQKDIQKSINFLQAEQERCINEDGKISTALVDAVSDARNQYNSSVTRQQHLYKALTTTRNQRLSGQIKENATILNLVAAWKGEQERREFIQRAETRKQLLGETIDEISKWDDMIGKIFGISKDEVLDG